MKQHSLTILVPVIPDRVEALLRLLAELRKDLVKGFSSDLDELGIIHYARWVIIDHGKSWINDDQPREPKLLFVIDYDGDETEMLALLCARSADLLDQVYANCEDYQKITLKTQDTMASFLANHRIKDAAVYIGAPGRSVQQIKEERNLRNSIRAYLDSRSWKGVTAKEVHRHLQDRFLHGSEFSFLKSQSVSMPRINYLGVIVVGIIGLALLPLIIIWVLILHFFYEQKDENFTLKRSQLNGKYLSKLEQYEDWTSQNQFTQLVDMKEGKVRLITIRFMFVLTNFLIKFIFNQGKLLGIPTIHFAKWVMFDKNSRVLFFSNFDGSWQQYLGDFIDNSGWGLTGIFSNTKVFPKTNFLITGGAYLEEKFLAWSRNSELETNYWYSAYPDLSIKNVNNNTKIRIGLLKSLSEKQAAKYLKLL